MERRGVDAPGLWLGYLDLQEFILLLYELPRKGICFLRVRFMFMARPTDSGNYSSTGSYAFGSGEIVLILGVVDILW